MAGKCPSAIGTATKQPLSERSTNQQSPMKSPSKIALPPSPLNGHGNNYEESCHTKEAQSENDGPACTYIGKDVTLAKPALFRGMSAASTHSQTYISPSDNILSPTTKKLTEVKGRRFAASKKSALYNPSNLFAKIDLRGEDDKSG